MSNELRDAIDHVEANHPLPRCEHDQALRDHSGEALEPPCGCRASVELTLDEAIKAAQAWQDDADLIIPAEIVTGLVDGAIELKSALRDVRILLLPDTTADMRPTLASITRAKERIRRACEVAGVKL